MIDCLCLAWDASGGSAGQGQVEPLEAASRLGNRRRHSLIITLGVLGTRQASSAGKQARKREAAGYARQKIDFFLCSGYPKQQGRYRLGQHCDLRKHCRTRVEQSTGRRDRHLVYIPDLEHLVLVSILIAVTKP